MGNSSIGKMVSHCTNAPRHRAALAESADDPLLYVSRPETSLEA